MIFDWSSPIRFLTTVFRTIGYWVSGRPVLAPKAIAEERQAICSACPRNLNGQCAICTCFVSVKTLLAHENCPDDPARWKKLTFSKPPPKDDNVA